MNGPDSPHSTVDDLVREVLETIPLIDGHNDLAWEIRTRFGSDLGRIDLGEGCPQVHTDLPRLAAGGVRGQFWSVYVPSTMDEGATLVATLEQLDLVRRMVARHAGHLGLAWSADDVLRVAGTGRVASLVGVEGGHSIAGSLGVLRLLAEMGARYLTLTHNHNVAWADSATDAEVLGGLSDFGEEVVAELNRLGMLVDLSHVSPGTMRHALRVTRAPAIFSHSSARALVDHPRNVPDDVLRLLPGNGGVCMVTFVPSFVSAAVAAWDTVYIHQAQEADVDVRDLIAVERFRSSLDAAPPRATVEDVADHVDHVRDVAGIDHVGLGGDFDGTTALPLGLEDVAGYPRLLAVLARRGWSHADLSALVGGNILRVMRDAEDASVN